MALPTREYRAPDGRRWTATIRNPGSTTALLVFSLAGGAPHDDRYAHVVAKERTASSVTGTANARELLAGLSEADLAGLFARSVRVSAGRSPLDWQ